MSAAGPDLPYDPDVAAEKLAEWQIEANRNAILADVFQQHADDYRDTQHHYEHKSRTLRARMQEDHVEVAPDPPRVVDLMEALEASLAAAKRGRS